MSAPTQFDPGAVTTFRIVGRRFDPATRTAHLGYAFDDGTSFGETITFETPPAPAGDPAVVAAPPAPVADRAGLDRALLHLHIAAGTSYYKAAAPDQVRVEGVALTDTQAELHRHLYDDGLREFAVANGLPVPRPVVIGSDQAGTHPTHLPVVAAPPHPGPGGLLVPIGGGKDSMVLIEAVRHLRPRLFAVNPHPLVVELAGKTGLELIVVRRRLAPELAELNRAGALNGHVPITAIVSLIAVAGSFLYGYDTIAMAVERSASEETVTVGGVPVNHQYSKSLAFERLLRHLIATSIDPGLTYGSALRPYSELAIARAFARLTEYHATFCSCNTAFRQQAGADDRWCGHCPKCRFVGLMLAPFLAPEAVTAIIGRDMFADPGQVEGFAALMSDADKPFECVGERRESAAAMRMLAESPRWAGTPVVAALTETARRLVSEAEVAKLLVPDPATAFPDRAVAEAVDRLLGGDGRDGDRRDGDRRDGDRRGSLPA